MKKEYKKPDLKNLKKTKDFLKKIYEKEPSDEILEIISDIEMEGKNEEE